MTITMLLSAALLLAVAALCFALAAADRYRRLLQSTQTALDSLTAAHARLKHGLPHLPPLRVRVCAEDAFAGWVEIGVGDHNDAMRVVMRLAGGEPAPYGRTILAALARLAEEGQRS